MFLHSLVPIILGTLAMTIKATKFTPDVLLSAPRRTSGVPNADASQILYKVNTYSFAEHAWTREIRVLTHKSNGSSLVTNVEGASDPVWVGEDGDVLVLVPGEKGSTDFVVGKVGDFNKS
jgi:hypothetical protein